MAASSASADGIETARDLKLPEVMGWFSDLEKKRAVCTKFMAARHTAMMHSEAWARTNWTETCEVMRQHMGENQAAGDPDFAFICDMLDSSVQPVQEPPKRKEAEAVHEEKKKRKRQPDTEGRGPVVDAQAVPQSSDMIGARKERKKNAEFEHRLYLFRKFLSEELAAVDFLTTRAINKKFAKCPNNAQLNHIRNMGSLWKNIHGVTNVVACSIQIAPGYNFFENGKLYTFAGSVQLCDGKTLCLYRDNSVKDEGCDSEEEDERLNNDQRADTGAVSSADACDAALAAETSHGRTGSPAEATAEALSAGSPEGFSLGMTSQMQYLPDESSRDSGLFALFSKGNEKQAIENAAAPAVTGMGGGGEMDRQATT